MFSKTAFFVTALVASAMASPLIARTTEPSVSQCNTGSTQCCNQVQKANSDSVAGLLGLLGIVVQDVNALVGVGCTPISVIGLGGNSCTQQPVCCSDNHFNGLVAVGCTPINVNV